MKSPFTKASFALLLLIGQSIAYANNVDSGIAAIKAGKYAEALKIIRPLAAGGDPVAQRLIGEMYYQGQGLPLNKVLSFKWNEAAADQGDMLAEYSVGYLYEMGEGVTRSIDKALDYYKKSALQRYAPAQVKVGDIYRDRDRSMAVTWYNLAMQNGSDEGREKFSRLSSVQVADRVASQKEADAEKKQELEASCAEQCPVKAQREYCLVGLINSSACTEPERPQRAEVRIMPSVAGAIQAELSRNQRSASQVTNAHNQMLANLERRQDRSTSTEPKQERVSDYKTPQTAVPDKQQYSERASTNSTSRSDNQRASPPVFKYTRSITWKNDFPSKTEAGAKEGANQYRRKYEPSMLGLTLSHKVTNVGPMECETTKLNYASTGYICKFVVSYDVTSNFDPDSRQSGSSSAIGR